MIVTPNHFCLQEHNEREATLVLASDGSVAVTSAAPWSISSVLIRHDELLLLDYHRLQGAAKLRKTNSNGFEQFECNNWSRKSKRDHRSVGKNFKEAAPCSTIATILGVLFACAHDVRATNPRLDECIYHRHEDCDSFGRCKNRLQRVPICASCLTTGYTIRHPALRGVRRPILPISYGPKAERYSLQLEVPGIYRTPAFSLPLLHEYVVYDFMSRKSSPSERKCVKGLLRLIRGLSTERQKLVWKALETALSGRSASFMRQAV